MLDGSCDANNITEDLYKPSALQCKDRSTASSIVRSIPKRRRAGLRCPPMIVGFVLALLLAAFSVIDRGAWLVAGDSFFVG